MCSYMCVTTINEGTMNLKKGKEKKWDSLGRKRKEEMIYFYYNLKKQIIYAKIYLGIVNPLHTFAKTILREFVCLFWETM